MRLAELLWLTAIGIAVLGWLDPPVVVAPQQPVPVDVALVQSERDAMPAEAGRPDSRADRARAVADELRAALGAAGDVHVHVRPAAAPLPCDAQRPCVVVSGGPVPRVAPDRRGATFLVRVGSPLAPNVTVVGLAVEASHTAAAGEALVSLRGTGVGGRATRVRLMDGDALIGEAVHRWSGDGEVRIGVPWWPIAPGTRTLVARAVLEGDSSEPGLDNEARAAVTVAADQWPVLSLERRPSWAATFARRAIEADPRFVVDVRTDVAPGVSARTAGATSWAADERLDRVRAILIGAPEALSADEVSRLEAFVRRRGGGVVLVPDRDVDGPVTRLLGPAWRRHETPVVNAAGGLQGREWLLAVDMTGFDEAVASIEEGPVVVSTPVGSGQVIVVGALDAWRHRGAGDAYDGFWRSLVARVAQGAGPSIAVTVEPRTAAPGDDLVVRVASRSVRDVSTRTASARLSCDQGAPIAVRLWPDHAASTFVGRARVPAGARRCTVTGEMVGQGEGRTDVVVTSMADSVGPDASAAFEAAVARTGGLVTTDRELQPLLAALRALASDIRTPEPRYPMRSPWWLLPLVACLAGEWWLRRRTGLR